MLASISNRLPTSVGITPNHSLIAAQSGRQGDHHRRITALRTLGLALDQRPEIATQPQRIEPHIRGARANRLDAHVAQAVRGALAGQRQHRHAGRRAAERRRRCLSRRRVGWAGCSGGRHRCRACRRQIGIVARKNRVRLTQADRRIEVPCDRTAGGDGAAGAADPVRSTAGRIVDEHTARLAGTGDQCAGQMVVVGRGMCLAEQHDDLSGDDGGQKNCVRVRQADVL